MGDVMDTPLLTICIPVYNEGENIEAALLAIKSRLQYPFAVDIVYDFDGDNTLPVVRKVMDANGMNIRLVRNKYGRGVLNAIKTGLEEAASKYVIVTMADLSDPPEVMNGMIAAAETRQADIVCASRYMRGGRQIGGPLFKGLMSRFAGLTLYHLAGLPTHDATNSFKLYRKSFLAATPIESTGGFELGIELVVKAHLNHYRIAEVPTTWTDRVAGKSNFQLRKWLPKYLRWYFSAFRRRKKNIGGERSQ